MADTKKSPATLLDELELRKVAETFAEVPDGRDTAHTLGLLAHMLDSD